MTDITDTAARQGAELAALANDSRAWPFEEARKLITRLDKVGHDKTVIFETGYGPSGLPHIGTFGEVARTTMVRHAFRTLTQDKVPTRLICFSDDMDGLRKVPGNVPNQELLQANIDKPLTQVPDPFGKFRSFGEHNNAMLRSFLDAFDFDYEFISATDCYTSGRFDMALLKVLELYDEVMAVMLPSLRAERQATYSPFLPICPHTGRVLQVPIIDRDLPSGAIVYKDPDTGKLERVKVTGGNCKLQWKADWAMRWYALGIDYEMSGKDLIDSVKLSNKICRVLGGTPPDGFNYELFLDENGEKISKSRGNGLTIDDWLRYASPESLALFMFQSPRKAKRLYFDVIPRNVDDYQTFLEKYQEQSSGEQPSNKPEERLANPVWHVHSGEPPKAGVPISFSMLLNLVSASNSEDRDVLWGFIRGYMPEASPESHPELDKLVSYAIHYFHDFVAPNKMYRAPSETERAALVDLSEKLGALPKDADAATIQNIVYEVGKTHPFDNLRDWFKALYEVLIGQSQGPRFGSFVALYGIEETRALIGGALGGSLRGS